MARQYTKKNSTYWNNLSKSVIPNIEAPKPDVSFSIDYEPLTAINEGTRVSFASQARSRNSGTQSKTSSVSGDVTYSKYQRIREFNMPFISSGNAWEIQDAIELCQRAYANVPIFRNAIDIMSEFSNAEIYWEGGSEKAREFFRIWADYVKIWKVKDQFFREFFRSGNVFFYKVVGELKLDDFISIVKSYASSNGPNSEIKNEIPVQYTLLNPYYIAAQRTSGWQDLVYVRVYSQYELKDLKHQSNDRDKLIFKSLDQKVRDAIMKGGWSQEGMYIPINPKHLITSFYKKQDYEPFATPFGYPVLDDINFKLDLKRIDSQIGKSIENAILLITMGNEPSKGGVNAKNITAMQTLLSNNSTGRTIIADYTTKGEWLIPDLNKVLGYDKYQLINEDIKEGLQNILIGSDKFSNTQVKASVFFERLKESRNAFINDFLLPETRLIFKNLGFKGKCPVPRFEEVSIKDETQFNRVVTRLMELGILAPEEGIKVIQTGLYPTPEELAASQEKLLQERKKGYYNPLVGGTPMIAPPEGANPTPASKKKENGRPTGSKASIPPSSSILQVIEASKELCSSVESSLKSLYKRKSLNAEQKKLASEVTESIMIGSNKQDWQFITDKLKNDLSVLMGLNILPEIQQISEDHELTSYPAALLFHASKL